MGHQGNNSQSFRLILRRQVLICKMASIKSQKIIALAESPVKILMEQFFGGTHKYQEPADFDALYKICARIETFHGNQLISKVSSKH